MSGEKERFYTVRGYELLSKDANLLTPSMEDYLEMVYRLSCDKGYTRISDLAAALNVQPPSATNMVQKLAETPYLKYERYGLVELTESGREVGEYLLRRHETLEEFLQIIGVEQGVLQETEKIEHNVSPGTMQQIILLVHFFQKNPACREAFHTYQKESLAGSD
jgi:Mn-dependent DtxR family transcriptional regulator